MSMYEVINKAVDEKLPVRIVLDDGLIYENVSILVFNGNDLLVSGSDDVMKPVLESDRLFKYVIGLDEIKDIQLAES